MAVVQISKIQHRRGLKNSNVGIPQLSSAEFAWSIDTQELFIGNGSVAEGAPYVGNTKVLTEHDNIMELLSSYTFEYGTEVAAVERSLQSKLDEYVSILDFGDVDRTGSTDCVAVFEKAFTELFRFPTSSQYKKTLVIPNGTYRFSSNLTIPGTAQIKGETGDNVILNIGTNSILFISDKGTAVSLFSSTDRPEKIKISNLTISHTTGQVALNGLKDSVIENVTFKSTYSLGDTVTSLPDSASVTWENRIFGTAVTNVEFRSCKFLSTPVGIHCSQTDQFETIVSIRDCYFLENDTSIYVAGTENQTTSWNIVNSQFTEVSNQVFRSTAGRGTVISGCSFKRCGVGSNNDDTNPTTSMIVFGQPQNNVVINCNAARQQAAGTVLSSSIPAYPEVLNSNLTSFVNANYATIFLSDSFRPVAVLSADNNYNFIDYVLKLSSNVRYGRLTITVDGDNGVAAITDSYQYSSSLISDPGGLMMTNFEFNAELKNNTGDSTKETVALTYKNPLSSGAVGTLTYFVNYGV